MIHNTQSITSIKAEKRISLFCPLGNDYYTADIYITFIPNEYYMDYIDLDKFINGLSGMKLTIEDAAEKVYQELQQYKPSKTNVTIKAFSNTHLYVEVTKGDNI